MQKLRKSIRKRIDRLTRFIGSFFYEPMHPSLMVLGVQKGGTTALFKYLCQHPQIVPSKKKELYFFNYDQDYARGIESYHRNFELATPARADKITIDVTPGYFAAGETAAERIHRYDPSVRMVVLLRDPVKRAYSAWQMYRKRYQKDPDWFMRIHAERIHDNSEEFVRRPAYGESFHDDVRFELQLLAQGRAVEMPLLPEGCYATHLEAYYRHFPRENLLLLDSDDLRKDTAGTLRLIEDHAGLAHHDWRRADTDPHFEGGYREKISPEALRLLSDYYALHNRRLFSLLGREFDWS